MQITPELRKTLLRFAILGILSFCIAFAIHLFSIREKDQLQGEQAKLEEALRMKEQQLVKILETVLQNVDNTTPFENHYKTIYPRLYEEEGMTVFLYRNDSLLAWSNNHVPAEHILHTGSFAKPFILYSNGWFRVISSSRGNLKAVGLLLVKNNYPYQNEYLVNDFQEDFGLPSVAEIDTIPGQVNIKSETGEFLFSVDFNQANQRSTGTNYIILAFLILSFVSLLITLFYLYHLFDFFTRRPALLFAAFVIDALIFRILLIYFEIPGFLYQSYLFSPYLYATSFFSPSLGDLLINSIFWLALAWLFYSRFTYSLPDERKQWKFPVSFLLMLISGGIYYQVVCTLRKMVVDSNLELNLNNIFNVDVNSGIAFLSMTTMILAFFFVSSRLMIIAGSGKMKKWEYVVLAMLASLAIAPLFKYEIYNWWIFIYPLLFFIYIITHLYFSGKKTGFRNISGALVYIVFFALLATFVLDYFLSVKEKENRILLSTELASGRDPMMEYEFSSAKKLIAADTILSNRAREIMTGQAGDVELNSRIEEVYFNDFISNYDLFITVCRPEEVLMIQPEGYLENCHAYFNKLLGTPESEEVAPGLFFLNRNMDRNNYIGMLEFFHNTDTGQDTLKVFIELFYKYFYESGLGYPDLLMDKKAANKTELGDYSYANYIDDRLVYKNGDFSYPLGFQAYARPDSSSCFLDNEGYNHYIVQLSTSNKLIISKKNPTILDLAAPFSYLFIIFSLFLIVFLSGYIATGGLKRIEFNFSNQLQVSIIVIIVISFLVLGLITRSNIINLYNEKNRDNLSEKTFSVLTELEHKLGNEEALTENLTGYIDEYLTKFSAVFFTDINLYDTKGTLISSSRPQIFEEELLSVKMNTEAYYKLVYEESLLYIQNEKIGRQEYLSAYIPFRNNKDQIIAYLNLPYFAKQTELRKEIGDFLAAYINVYVLLIVLAIMVTILVSRIITRPLQLIREKLRNLELGKPNEKIIWKKKDEIGDLVDEYNRMIDELAKSAEMLARSERESAWREMAKQVAHEIKNPLTPMKLSVQYLQKAWNDKSPDWEKRLSGFTKTIVEQIDSLSEIATAFSDFAKMPAARLERIEVTEIIKSAADLYHHHSNILITTESLDDELFVIADRKQLLRVFNNLIQNAVQAIGKKDEGKIHITISKETDFCLAEIKDNGSGITPEEAEKIFSPSFTTKSSGMGLGLAMVKSILTSINGTVSFESKPGEGATFRVKIPVSIS